jgi:hypothetical protein
MTSSPSQPDPKTVTNHDAGLAGKSKGGFITVITLGGPPKRLQPVAAPIMSLEPAFLAECVNLL